MSKRKFERGDEVILNSKTSSYNKKRGFEGLRGVIDSYNYNSTYVVVLENKQHVSDYATAFDKVSISTIEHFNLLIEKAQAKIKATEAFIVETQAKINFLTETGSDEFNENEFKAYHTLGIIEQSNMTKIEKAKAIAALISGK